MRWIALLVCCCLFASSTAKIGGYFDPHSHVNGNLPWQSLANMEKFHRGESPSFAEKLALWNTFANLPEFRNFTGETIPVYNTSSRIAAGAYATVFRYNETAQTDENVLDGVLERLLTSTPFTEFDSAYKFRGVANVDLKQQIENTITHLKEQHILASEQSISMTSCLLSSQSKSCWIGGFMNIPGQPHQLLFMAFANLLGMQPDGKRYTSFLNPQGTCQLENFVPSLYYGGRDHVDHVDPFTEARLMGKALRGEGRMPEACGWSTEDQFSLWNVIAGIDIAAAEVNCVTPTGIEYFKELARQIRTVSGERRQAGWNKKMTLHVHMGEGFSALYGKDPLYRSNLQDAFSSMPYDPSVLNVISNPEVSANNLDRLVTAMQEMLEEDDTIPEYMIFRVGHCTHLTRATAEKVCAMSRSFPDFVEADINLDSNLITGAYRIPSSVDLTYVNELLRESETSNLAANDLSALLIPDDQDCDRVAEIYGDFDALRYLLECEVPVVIPIMLGTDGPDVEHAPMERQHNMGKCLIRHWKKQYPQEFGHVRATHFITSMVRHMQNTDPDWTLPNADDYFSYEDDYSSSSYALLLTPSILVALFVSFLLF